MSDYDVLVIGSGAGGLTAALALARAGSKVLVLEQHYVPGGWCHSFKLDRFRYSPGVHYVGELQPGGRLRRIVQGLGVGQDLTFFELNPDGFDHVQVGDQRVDIPRGVERLRSELSDRFPGDARGIGDYLALCQALHAELSGSRRRPADGGPLRLPLLQQPTLLRYGLRHLGPWLRRHIRSPLLQTVLAMPCGDHGMPPERAPLPLHASVVGHYFDGAYYPHRGGAGMVQALVRGLKRHGGELRLSTAVRRILLHDGRAVGVELEDGERLTATHVISNADPHVTFGKLLPKDHLGWRLRRQLRQTRYSLSAISLFAAVEMDLERLGFDSGNTWYFARPGLDHVLNRIGDDDLLGESRFRELFLSVTTLKDRTTFDGRTHILESFHFVPYAAFARWDSGPAGPRQAGYLDLKAYLQERMLTALEAVIPGLRQHLVFAELGTPLTNRFYTAGSSGNLYGTEKRLLQIGPFGFGTASPVPGLSLCGASTLGHGVLGAATSGLVAAAQHLRCDPWDLLDERQAPPTVLSADDTSQWPERLLQMQARKHRGPESVGAA